MKKYKKSHQKRKRYKVATQRKTKDSGRPQPSFSPAPGKAVKVLIGAAIVACIGTVVFFSLKHLLPTDRNSFLSVKEPLRTEQDITEIKKEEMQLAEKLMSDFGDNENSLMIMGNVLHRYGDAAQALKFYEKVLKINPNRPDIYNVMGEFSLSEGNFEEAIGYWRKALALNPGIPKARSNIGHALMILGRPDEAIEQYQREIEISPDSGLTYFLLGQAYLQKKEYEKAKENYEVTIRIKPDFPNAYYGLATISAYLGDTDKARDYSEKFKNLKERERKDLKGRKILYDDFEETQKLAALTFIEAAQIYRDTGNSARAQELLTRAAGLDPQNVKCLLELASMYQKNNQPLKALQLYTKLIEIEPENPIYHFGTGILSALLKQFDEAEQAFRTVIKLAPQQSAGYNELASLYLKTGQKSLQALQLAEKAVALEPIAANYFILSMACSKNGDNARALSAITRAVKLEPDNPRYQHFYKLIQQRN